MKSLTIDEKPKILSSQLLKERIDRVEKRAQISVREYIGFGDIAPGAIKYFKDEYRNQRIGELNSDNKLHGRGINIDTNGNIYIGYWNNGVWRAPGNFIRIFEGGLLVGERYLKDGELCRRGTEYKNDGTSKKFD